MTDIGSEAPAWLAVPSARAGERPAAPDARTAGDQAVRGDDEPAVPGARTGETRGAAAGGGDVESALSPLVRLAEAPVSEHVGVFEDVLTGLEAVLASVDEPQPDPRRDDE